MAYQKYREKYGLIKLTGFFLTKDMQTTTLRSGHIYMKDAYSSESNEKSIFRFFLFLFFELWLIVSTIYGDTPGFSIIAPTKIFQKWPNSHEWAETNKKSTFIFFRFLVFEIWSILYWYSKIFFMIARLHPP